MEEQIHLVNSVHSVFITILEKNYIALRVLLQNYQAASVLFAHPKFKNDPALNMILYRAAVKGDLTMLKNLMLDRHINPTFCNNLVRRTIQAKLSLWDGAQSNCRRVLDILFQV